MRVNRQRTMSCNRMTVQATAATDDIRTEQLNGIDHMVVPIIALVEGVLHPSNAPFKELALASEFGKVTAGWDGRPIVFNHPKVNDDFVSANSSPEVAEAEIFGQMFNTKVEDNKLKTEAWINLDRVNALGQDVQDAVKRLESGEITEVSTGLFVSLEEREGEFEGEQYGGVWREVVPDHLAILSEGSVGASSVEDGAGAPRLNSARISSSPPAEIVKNEDEDKKGFFQSLGETAMNLLGLQAGLSDNDLRTALDLAVGKTTGEFTWIVSVFADDGYFVYEQGFSGKLLKRNFEISNDVITLADEVEDVRPKTEFIPATTKKETDEMKISAERVAALIANANSEYTEADTEFLSGQPEVQFARLEKFVADASVEPKEEVEEVDEEAEAPKANEGAEDESETPETLEDFINKAPKEIQEVLNSGVRLGKVKRETLTKGILANKQNKFDEATLDGMDLVNLENIASLANVPDYGGSSPVIKENEGAEDNYAPLPPSIFAKKEA